MTWKPFVIQIASAFYLLLTSSSKFVFTEKSKDYDLKFQAKSLSNNVSMAISNEPINALTFCIWFQTTQSGSFGLVGGDLDLICDEYSQCNFSLKGAKR